MIKDEARVGCCCHNSTSTELHSAGGRVAGWWPATVVVGADSVSGPSGSLGLRTPPSCSSAQCPKSFSMGEQRSAFTGNSQLEADRKETSFGKKKTVSAIHPAIPCQRVEVAERLSLTPEISFFCKIVTDLPAAQQAKPTFPFCTR